MKKLFLFIACAGFLIGNAIAMNANGDTYSVHHVHLGGVYQISQPGGPSAPNSFAEAAKNGLLMGTEALPQLAVKHAVDLTAIGATSLVLGVAKCLKQGPRESGPQLQRLADMAAAVTLLQQLDPDAARNAAQQVAAALTRNIHDGCQEVDYARYANAVQYGLSVAALASVTALATVGAYRLASASALPAAA